MATKKAKVTTAEGGEPKKKRGASEETVKLRRYLNARRAARERRESVDGLTKKLAEAEAKLKVAEEEAAVAKAEVGEL